MKTPALKLLCLSLILAAYAVPVFAGNTLGPVPTPYEFVVADKLQDVLWVLSFIALLLPTFIFENRQKEYAAKQVNIPLKHFVLNAAVILPLVVMIIVYAAFMAVDFYSSCTPAMWFVYSYILAGVLWLAMLQPAWIYLVVLKVEKADIVKRHSAEFYENNRAFFDKWAKWLAFGIAVFLAVVSLASFYYMDRLNWANCQQAH
ncbi:MAG: hypothetical protein PSY14_00920 [bacterium]|nr:hypothetical protein [bacterium]